MKVTVVGSGISGKSLALMAKSANFDVFVTEQGKLDENTKALFREKDIQWEEGEHTKALLDCDLVVLSSGISDKTLPVQMARKTGTPLQGELDFIYPYLSGKIVGVTGTNGKSTTAALINHLLSKMGYNVALAGNFGIPLADFAMMPLDFIVVELSSFQLHWTKRFSCDVAIITNIYPDHLDWHGSFEAYVNAKRRIIELLSPKGCLVYRAQDEEILQVREGRVARLYWSFEKFMHDAERVQDELILNDSEALLRTEGGHIRLFPLKSLSLFGYHNVENAAMAMAAIYYLGCEVERAREFLPDFKNLPHRCEKVGEKDGVVFIDDSKGTNVASSVTAIASIPGVKVVILGGRGKGEKYDKLAGAIKKHVRAAVLLGEEKEVIAKSLRSAGFSNFYLAASMKEAVYKAFEMACPGDIVLLSPACTSWDMYRNYHERGKDFQEIVKNLIEACVVKNGRESN